MASLLSILAAIIALSVLIFIHELGHYFMALKEKMRVETFSIGFGRPLVHWYWQGVKWQVGWLLFGGYVKIAGTEADKNTDPYAIKDGFFGKSPWSRIKVALMGPVVNLIFALLVFALLWVSGGREKPFTDYTHRAGWIDPKSELYAQGFRPGDEIWSFNGKPYQGAQDLLYLSLAGSRPIEFKGAKVNYLTQTKSPFTLTIHPYPHPSRLDGRLTTTGILAPANYLVYDRLPNGTENPLPENSPMKNSGIEYGDHIVWMDGHLIYSLQQLSSLLNDGRALVTIERNGKVQLARVPRVEVKELKLDNAFRDELKDWQFEAGLKGVKFLNLYVLPYNLTNDGVVEGEMRFIDKDNQQEAFPDVPLSPLEIPLQAGDRVIAVDGMPIKHSSEILKLIQERAVHLIVKRTSQKLPQISWKEEDKLLDHQANQKDIDKIASSIGSKMPTQESGDLRLLNPIEPKTHHDIYLASVESNPIQEALDEQKQQIKAMEDSEQRSRLLQLFAQKEKKLELGLPVRDLPVVYNPIPTTQFMIVFNDICRTLSAVISDPTIARWLSGPVGIVHLFQEQSRSGIGDSLYWLGVISLNLGVFNLLPIPMLDGGTIVLSLFEALTGKKIKPKTMEKLILPFAILLIAFFIFLTYQDIARIFGVF